MRQEFIEIGRIVNAHGIRGEVRVQPLERDADYLTRLHTFYLDGAPVVPTANHVHKGLALVKLPGVDDMNAALALKGKILSVRRSDAPLEAGACFDQELPGTEVFDADTGERLGVLTLVELYPAQRVYTVQGPRTFRIPAVPEVFIQFLDLDANRMEVHMLEGLFEDEN
jgi:16S rRNA processing protein RimM